MAFLITNLRFDTSLNETGKILQLANQTLESLIIDKKSSKVCKAIITYHFCVFCLFWSNRIKLNEEGSMLVKMLNN